MSGISVEDSEHGVISGNRTPDIKVTGSKFIDIKNNKLLDKAVNTWWGNVILVFILPIAIGLIIQFLTFKFGWNK